jgi:hypothetical protein
VREAKTINDLRDLFNDHSVTPVLDGDKVYLVMQPTEEWEPNGYERGQVSIRSRSVITSDPEDLQVQAEMHNAVVELVHNPQFWRCTTVADQMTRFYGYDGGSMPAMFLRGKGRSPSRQHRIVGLTKKAGTPFTIHFESPEAAQTFLTLVGGSNGEKQEAPAPRND